MSVTDTPTGFTRVLVANRGEIAVRVVRAAADAGLESVAVYADPDAGAPFVRMADQAFALGGTSPADTYLSIERVLAAAERSGADAVHPGYGFLSENADFAQAVIDAGLTWIGPPPQAMRDLGDKVTARHLALRVGAPLVPGTPDPVSGADEAVAFGREHGLPIAIKAAFGGGGRGMKVARTIEEIPELFDSATREAVAAFGRGECFVERYLDRPRHVEAQVLADSHGGVIVVGTRDCSLQRRFAKLVEEAPAPFLTDAQREQIVSSSTAICREAGYVGAGTVEYLMGQDGLLTFLEVNTRLQVEHPVTEETSGIDLVLAQFAIAAGERVPPASAFTPRGHSLEFRITAEDPRAQFLPAQGTVGRYTAATGPGVRLDSGIEDGTVVGAEFDSLLAKLVVTGASRAQALARARRALAELRIDGLPTSLDFHRAVVRDPAFVGDEQSFGVHTRWIETEWSGDLGDGPATSPARPPATPRPAPRTMVVEVDGRRLSVRVLDDGLPAAGSAQAAVPTRRRASGAGSATVRASTPEGAVLAPLTGTVTRVAVQPGAQVSAGDLLVVLEAMKMEHAVTATADGRIGEALVEVGATVAAGDVLVEVHAG